MRTNFSFRFPKNTLKFSQKQRNNTNNALKTINERLPLRRGRSDSQNFEFLKPIDQVEAQEWLFSDQKIKTAPSHIKGRQKIETLAQPQLADRNSKELSAENSILEKKQLLMPQKNQQLMQKTIKRNKVSKKYSKEEVIKLQVCSNQQIQKSLKRSLTQRSKQHTTPGLKDTKNTPEGSETYFNLNVFLKKSDFSLSLKKTKCHERKSSNQKQIIKKSAILRANSQNTETHFKKEQFRQKYLSQTMNLPARGLENKSNDQNQNQNQKFSINGWQVNSPVSPDLYGIQRYQTKEPQVVTVPQKNTALRK